MNYVFHFKDILFIFLFTLKRRLGTPLASTISNLVEQLLKYLIYLYTFFQIRKMLENLTITEGKKRIKKPLITFQYLL